jgi:hypothetical protein
MKAEQLRIGNIIQDFAGNFFEFKLQDFCNIENFKIDVDEYCKPIIITEEILLNFGFEECKDYYFCGKSMFFYDINKSLENSEFYICFNENNKICLSSMENDDTVSKSLNIKYVHQLQNLYFALTGQELKYETR